MQAKRNNITFFIVCALACIAPLFVGAQSTGFQTNGIFGCNQTGSYAMSVGALSAIGGVYVPVNDAAVTLNTGYLVYKECVLRPIVDRESEAETSNLATRQLVTFLSGNNGNPLFPQQLAADRQQVADMAVNAAMNNATFSQLNPAFKDTVVRAAVNNYYIQQHQPQQQLACNYQGDLNALMQGQSTDSVWDTLSVFENPACNPLFAYQMASDLLNSEVSSNVSDWQSRLTWNNGTYDRISGYDASGNPIVVTPGTISTALVTQALQSGFTKTQNANDIGQMVGSLFAGMGNQAVSDIHGLAGLITPSGSQPSYLNLVAQQSQNGLIASAENAALQILNAAMQVEAGYNKAMNTIAQALIQTIAQLRTQENQCWNLIIQNVCATPLTSKNECTTKQTCTTDPSTQQQSCQPGITLVVSTSTAYSQPIIDSQIAPLASSTATNIDASNKAQSLIQGIVTQLTSSQSLQAQQQAMQQLDALVAQNALHSQYDLTNATQQASNVQASMQTLITNTAQTWGDGTDPSTGWCNVNNPAVLTYWITKWTKK